MKRLLVSHQKTSSQLYTGIQFYSPQWLISHTGDMLRHCCVSYVLCELPIPVFTQCMSNYGVSKNVMHSSTLLSR